MSRMLWSDAWNTLRNRYWTYIFPFTAVTWINYIHKYSMIDASRMCPTNQTHLFNVYSMFAWYILAMVTYCYCIRPTNFHRLEEYITTIKHCSLGCFIVSTISYDFDICEILPSFVQCDFFMHILLCFRFNRSIRMCLCCVSCTWTIIIRSQIQLEFENVALKCRCKIK